MTKIPQGKIELGSKVGNSLGFTSTYFAARSYLWCVKDAIYISAIMARHTSRSGAFRFLVQNILAAGHRCLIPTPVLDMPDILEHWKAAKLPDESDLDGQSIEMWEIKSLPAKE